MQRVNGNCRSPDPATEEVQNEQHNTTGTLAGEMAKHTDETEDFPLGENSAGEVETRVLPLDGAVHVQRVAQPGIVE